MPEITIAPRRAKAARWYTPLTDILRIDMPPMRAAAPLGYTLTPHSAGSFPGCCWTCDQCSADGCTVRESSSARDAATHVRSAHGNERSAAA